MCGKELAILQSLWTKLTLWTVPIVVWCRKLIPNALGGRCPDLALSPKFFPMPARCASHKKRAIVVYHKVTVFSWFSWIFQISHWNACGMVRAAAITWHNPIPPYGRLAELACTGAPSARLQEHFWGNWVMPRYSRRPNHPASISVRDFENSRKP